MSSRRARAVALGAAATLILGVAVTTAPLAAAEPSEAPLSGKLVVWDWWLQLEDNGPVLKQIDEEFRQAHPNVELEHVGQPVDQWDALLRAANASRTGPDVAMIYGGAQGVLTYGEQGAFANLKDLMTPEQLAEYSTMEAGARGYDLANEIWAISMGINAATLYYNKQMFEAAGLDPANPPATFEEFFAACDALKEQGVIPFSQGNKDNYWAYFNFVPFWGQVFEKGEAAKLASGEIKFTDPRVKEIFQFLIDLADRGCYNEDWKGINTFFDAIDLFPAGKAAMTVGLMTGQGGVDKFSEMLGAENYGVQIPIEGSYVRAVPAVMYGITSYSQNPDAAAAYLRFVTTRGQQLLWEQVSLPPTWSGVTLGDKADPNLQVHLDAINANSELAVTSMLHPDVLNEIAAQIIQAANGTITLDAALEAIQFKADEVQYGE